MKTICLHIGAHQPYRLKKMKFFDIGRDHFYCDDNYNGTYLKGIADRSYMPLNSLLTEMAAEHGDAFKASIGISGILYERLQANEPEALESFRSAAGSDSIEVVAETYAHSLASIGSEEEFRRQVKKQMDMIKREFGKTPKTFCNTDLIFNNNIAEMAASTGFRTIMAEGAQALLDWRSPNYLYSSSASPKLRILTRNQWLSDALTFGYRAMDGDARVFVNMIKNEDHGEIINLYLDYEVFGEQIQSHEGIFDFLRSFVYHVVSDADLTFATPAEISKKFKPVGEIGSDVATSRAGHHRNLSTWLDNELQREAFSQQYAFVDKIHAIKDKELIKAWEILQSSDNLCTMSFNENDRNHGHNRGFCHISPYESFISYMNSLNDLRMLVEA